MPKGATVLNAANQEGEPHIWVMVDPDQPTQERTFVAIPTGRNFDPRGWQYIGTFHGVEGSMVFHLFETTI